MVLLQLCFSKTSNDVGYGRFRVFTSYWLQRYIFSNLSSKIQSFRISADNCNMEKNIKHFHLSLFRIIRAAMTPGTQPMQVRRKTMSIDPQPRSNTAKGGKIMARMTWRQDMDSRIICKLLFIENTIPMPFKEQWAWTMIFRQRYFKTFYRRKMFFIIGFSNIGLEFVC